MPKIVISDDEVLQGLHSSKNTRVSSPDDLPSCILKNSVVEFHRVIALTDI